MTRLLTIAAATLIGAAAHAHGTLPGSGGFYAGALHPVLTLEHLLLLVALGLLLGRGSGAPAKAPLLALAAAVAAGLALGPVGLAGPAVPLGILTGATLAGAGIAAGARLRSPALVALAAAAGLATGLDTGMPPAGVVAWVPYAGVFLGVFLIVLNAAAAAVACRPPYGVAVRVAGSWIAATAVMVLALHVRGMGGTA
jgi:hydrogenase/urease accessory protein HupE